MKIDSEKEKNKKTVEDMNIALKVAFLSKLYQSKFRSQPLIKDLKDVENVPFTTKQDLRDWYPYGNLATDFSNVVEMHIDITRHNRTKNGIMRV